MNIKHILAASLILLAAACSSNKTAGPIKVKVPARPAGQENVIGLTAPAMDTVRVGFVGLGMRGSGAVPRFTYIPGVKITALCDVVPENVEIIDFGYIYTREDYFKSLKKFVLNHLLLQILD